MNLFLLMVTFVLGVGVGLAVPRAGRGGGEFDPSASVFLDEEKTEEAEELRVEAKEAVQSRIEKRKDRIVAKAKAEGRITNDGVEDLFCISDATAGNYLQQLVKENRLNKVGTTGRGVYYEPIQKL